MYVHVLLCCVACVGRCLVMGHFTVQGILSKWPRIYSFSINLNWDRPNAEEESSTKQLFYSVGVAF